MTVTALRMAQDELQFSNLGMCEIIGVLPEVYGNWRSHKSPLLAGDAAWERINDALELRRIKEGK